jgi:uncharacterized RDD family membrane protein YckC
MSQPEPPVSPLPDAAAGASTTPFVLSFTPTPVAAPVLSRLIAYVIDFGGTAAITAGVVLLCVTIGFSDYNGTSGGGSTGYFGADGRGALVLVGVVAIVGIPLASVVVNVRLARTRMYSIGAFLMRIRVVDVVTHGPVPAGRLVARSAVLFVPGILTLIAAWSTFLVGAGFSIGTIAAVASWIVFAVPILRGDHRGLHDTVAGTRVLTAASVQAPA